MSAITTLFTKTCRLLIGSGAALVLTTAMTTSASAADIATTYDNSCAACPTRATRARALT